MVARGSTVGRSVAAGRCRDWPAQHVLRFLCVAGMLAVHGFYWTATMNGELLLAPSSPYYSIVASGMVLGVLPLLLPFTAGCALRFRLPPARMTPALDRGLVLQSLVLAALGFVMNVLAAGWYACWSFNVLQLVALSSIVVGALLMLGSRWPLLAVGAAVLLVSDPLRQWIPAGARSSMGRVLLGDPTDFHSWPFFPWFSTVVFGWMVADFFLETRGDRRFSWGVGAAGFVVVVGVSMFGQLVPAFDAGNIIGPSLMAPSALSTLGLLGVAALGSAALTAAFRDRSFRRFGIVRAYSNGILWIYIIHMIVGVRLSGYLFHHAEYWSVLNQPDGWAIGAFVLGFTALLMALGWVVGFLSIRWLREKRIHVRVRRARPVPT